MIEVLIGATAVTAIQIWIRHLWRKRRQRQADARFVAWLQSGAHEKDEFVTWIRNRER